MASKWEETSRFNSMQRETGKVRREESEVDGSNERMEGTILEGNSVKCGTRDVGLEIGTLLSSFCSHLLISE